MLLITIAPSRIELVCIETSLEESARIVVRQLSRRLVLVVSSLWCNSLTIAAIAKLPLLVSIPHVSKSPSAIMNDLVRALDQIEQLRIHLHLLIALVLMAFLPLTVCVFDVSREELRIEGVHNLYVRDLVMIALH